MSSVRWPRCLEERAGALADVLCSPQGFLSWFQRESVDNTYTQGELGGVAEYT